MKTNKIICFKQDTKERKQWFKAASFAHPAKMHLSLQIYLIERYTKPGDTILDPMAGSGTILIACALGRNMILVELEEKFVKMQQDNYEKIKSLGPMLGCQMGEAVILQGDARNLNGLLADNILFSPPFSEQMQDVIWIQKNKPRKNWGKENPKNRNLKNISNLPYGEISAVISSPPYAESQIGDNRKKHHPTISGIKSNGKHRGGSLINKFENTQENPNNIGNLSYGDVDAVITSPPYAETGVGDWKTGRDDFQKWVLNELVTKGYVEWQGKRYTESEWRALNHGRIDGRTTKGVHKHPTNGYGKTKGQIGNLPYAKADAENATTKPKEVTLNYLSEMLRVYSACHKVLKEKGLMVLVVKNFIRDKKIIRLDLDTIKICEKAGFKLKETLQRKLTQQSFWRIIYHQKYPDVPPIEFEDILVFQKQT